MPGRYEQDEYLEQDEEERERTGRRNSLIALLVMALLVIAGLVLSIACAMSPICRTA
jgi:hypothetical protein